jgi:DNA invertase Pin-like site-specific DNA recombinase
VLKLIIAVYCRVSTNSDDQANSFENQKSLFEREIANKGHQLYKIYADQGLSGTNIERPEFKQMIYDAGINIVNLSTSKKPRKSNSHTFFELSDREPKFNEIWVKNTSRFSRNTDDSKLYDLLLQKNVSVFFFEQGFNSKEKTHQIPRKIYEFFDEQESRDKSLKVRTGIAESAKKGVLFTNGKLFGYKYIQSENKLETIESEAKIIEKIFNLYAEGKGIRQILNYLNTNNLFTRFGKPFVKTSVRNILTNEKYAGMNNSLKYDAGIVFQKKSYAHVKEQYEVFDSDKIPPIVSKELFYKCRELLNSKVNYQNQKGIYKGVSKYSQLLYCGKCGHLYYSNQDRGRIFYNCSNKKMNGNLSCNNPNVSEKLVDEYIQSLADGDFNNYLKSFLLYNRQLTFKTIDNLFKSLDKQDKTKIEYLKKEIELSDEKLSRLYDMYSRQTVMEDVLDKQVEKEEIKNKNLKDEFNYANKTNVVILNEIKTEYNSYMENQSLLKQTKDKYSPDEILPMISSIKVEYGYEKKVNLIAQFARIDLDKYKRLYESLISGKTFIMDDVNDTMEVEPHLSDERINELEKMINDLS